MVHPEEGGASVHEHAMIRTHLRKLVKRMSEKQNIMLSLFRLLITARRSRDRYDLLSFLGKSCQLAFDLQKHHSILLVLVQRINDELVQIDACRVRIRFCARFWNQGKRVKDKFWELIGSHESPTPEIVFQTATHFWDDLFRVVSNAFWYALVIGFRWNDGTKNCFNGNIRQNQHCDFLKTKQNSWWERTITDPPPLFNPYPNHSAYFERSGSYLSIYNGFEMQSKSSTVPETQSVSKATHFGDTFPPKNKAFCTFW